MATSTDRLPRSPSAITAKKMAYHPLSPLTAAEITRSSGLVKSLYPPKIDLQFKVVTLEEPEKCFVVPYLHAEHHGKPLPSLERKAFVCYYIRNTVSESAKEGKLRLIGRNGNFANLI